MQAYEDFWKRLLRWLMGRAGEFPDVKLSEAERKDYQILAYSNLKYFTGQDFGYDVDAWRVWLDQHPNIIEEREERGELPPTNPKYKL